MKTCFAKPATLIRLKIAVWVWRRLLPPAFWFALEIKPNDADKAALIHDYDYLVTFS